MDKPTQQPTTQAKEPTVPQSTRPKTFQLRKNIILIIVVFIIVGICTGGYALGMHSQVSTAVYKLLNVPTPIPATKRYINSYYHFKLDIPGDWVVQEGTRPDGIPTVELLSSNKEITIDVNYDFQSTHEDQVIPEPNVQLGQYSIYRSRYLSGGNTVDYINPYNIPNQKGFIMTFTIDGDFEKNNAILLGILKTFAYTQKEPSITNFFNYSLPGGWKLLKDDPADNSVSFASSDYKIEEHVGYVTSGVLLFVTRNIADPRKTLQQIASEASPDTRTNDSKSIVISGLSGLTRHSDWESHSQVFFVIKNKYLWTVVSQTSGIADEEKHRKDVNSFVNSIQLK